MNLMRRDILVGAGALTLAGCATTGGSSSGFRVAAAPVSPSPIDIGRRAADAYLNVEPIMLIQRTNTRTYHGVHYADAACAYGAAHFAAATGDDALLARVKARHDRAKDIDNSGSHVDVNVYGVWPMELGMRLNDPALIARGRELADVQWAETTPDGLTSQARYWIDDVWMIGSLQIQAWRSTRDPKYLDRAALMARLYMERLQQPNGLFFHGPRFPFFWGRGNGWVAAGLAELLSELPSTHKDYAAVMGAYQRMMAGLLAHQAEDGMWHQLIDYPTSYKETSATAMFAYAFVIGARRGILSDPAYTRGYQKAWAALSTYVQPDGQLREICIGTGQQNNVEYYLNRPRRTGDFHGQAPLLWFAKSLVA